MSSDKLKQFALKLREDLQLLAARVSHVEKIRAIARDGRDGAKGAAGESGAKGDRGETGDRGPQGLAGRDGRDGVAGPKGDSVTKVEVETGNVLSVWIGEIKTLAGRIIVQRGEKGEKGDKGDAGPQGPKGDPGKNGRDGVSVTNIELKNRDLFVWLDGVRKKAGQISFAPLGAGGGGVVTGRVQLPRNWRVINSTGDFALQNDDTITLEEGITYICGAPIETGKRFIVSKNVAVVSFNSAANSLWRYTGTGTMFTGVNVESFAIDKVNAIAPAGQLFDFSDSTPKKSLFVMNTCALTESVSGELVANKFGTFTDLLGIFIIFSSATGRVSLGINDGITLGGTTLGLFSIDKLSFLSFSPTCKMLDLGSVVVDTAFEIRDFNQIGLTAGCVGISSDLVGDSGNVGTGILATISDCEFIGPIVPLVNITTKDTRYQFTNNAPLQDSSIDVFTYSTLQVIVAVGAGNQGVFFPVDGAWSEVSSNRFTVSSDGIATYTGSRSTNLKVDSLASVAKVGGGSDEISARINVDTGSGFPAVPDVRTESSTQSPSPTSVNPKDFLTINPGDRIQLWVANLSGTNSIIVAPYAKLILN